MRFRSRLSPFAIVFLALFGFLFFAAPAAAQDSLEVYLEYILRDRWDDTIPPPDSPWHQLYPEFCEVWTQTDYDDADQNGRVTICDGIYLDGIRYHIEWVGPTYHLMQIRGRQQVLMEPRIDIPPLGRDPTCEMWHVVYPEELFCTDTHVEGWDDQGSGELDPCDWVWFGPEMPGMWHIENITLNIRVVPDDAVESGSWGWIKEFFYRFFE